MSPLDATSLGGLVSSLYTYALSIVGLCVFIMFLLAGLGYILPDSIRPAPLSKPLDIIRDAVLGTILLFSAYVILNSINPDLVNQQETGTTTGTNP